MPTGHRSEQGNHRHQTLPPVPPTDELNQTQHCTIGAIIHKKYIK